MNLVHAIAGCLALGAGLVLVGCREKGEPAAGELSEAGYELNQEAWFRAAESDDLRALETMLKGGIALDTRDAAGRTALHAAAGVGALKASDFLLGRGLGIGVTDEGGRTPLMESVLRSTPEAVRHFLRQGADPQAKDAAQFKPLMLAVKEGRREMVPELAPYVRQDLDDALLAAAILGQAGVIDELTNYGASIYARVPDGRTALMLAAQKGHSDVVELLLEIGANRFARDEEGRLASDLAREAGYDGIATRLDEAPREDDFELVPAAELGDEMVERVVEAAVAPEDPAPGGGGGGIAASDAARDQPGVEPEPLEGAILGGTTVEGIDAATDDATRESDPGDAPVVMRSFIQRELPLSVESVGDDSAELRVAGRDELVEVSEGEAIPGSSLKVVRIQQRVRTGKEGAGATDVSVVEVEDLDSGVARELVIGLPALAHDPVALVEDASTGRYYVARSGQRFRAADGTEFLVADVRPNQLVIEEVASGMTRTVPLSGPRG